MAKIDEILHLYQIPEDIRKMVNSLNKDGRDALNSMYDNKSDFWKHANLLEIASQFFAEPKKYKHLYHYTDTNGLKGILTSRTFRIGSQYYMNDPQENIYVLEFAKKILKGEEFASPEEIEYFYNDFRRLIFDIYIWSFTLNDHSQALANYGEYALEFDNEELQESLVKFFNPNVTGFDDYHNGNCFVFPLKVEYGQKVQKEYIKSVVHTWLAAYRNLKIDPYDMGYIIENCYHALSLFCMCFKNPLLRQEEEIRFIVIRKNDDNKLYPDTYINNRPILQFKFEQSLLHQIIYNKRVKNLKEVENLLMTNGYEKTLVNPTKLPY